MTAPPYHLGFFWDQCCDYHMDRAEAVAEALGPNGRVTLIEVAPQGRVYDWPVCRSSERVDRITLFPGRDVEQVGELATARALLAAVRKAGITQLFLAGYEHPGRFAAALVLALTGRRPIIMLDSKFDDKPRRLRLELLKRVLLLPYRAGMASGARACAYLRFLGFHDRPIAVGYDTISVKRMQLLAQDVRPQWQDRAFLVVARLVPKKNIGLALRAFASLGDTRRQLRICGDGPLREAIVAEVAALRISDRVVLLGSVTQDVIAREMAGSLCLILPSHEEQWGLVVNEAVGLGVPVIAGDNVGAKDVLIGNYVNGFLLDCRDTDGWSNAMHALDGDRALWDRFVQGSRRRSADADVGRFGEGVLSLLGG